MALPGGQPGANHLNADARIHALLKKMAGRNQYTVAICAAPLVLANAGLLHGKQATSFPGVLEKMNLPDVELKTAAVVQDGKIITSRGPGTAMDFALTLIEVLMDKTKRDEVETGLARF